MCRRFFWGGEEKGSERMNWTVHEAGVQEKLTRLEALSQCFELQRWHQSLC